MFSLYDLIFIRLYNNFVSWLLGIPMSNKMNKIAKKRLENYANIEYNWSCIYLKCFYIKLQNFAVAVLNLPRHRQPGYLPSPFAVGVNDKKFQFSEMYIFSSCSCSVDVFFTTLQVCFYCISEMLNLYFFPPLFSSLNSCRECP